MIDEDVMVKTVLSDDNRSDKSMGRMKKTNDRKKIAERRTGKVERKGKRP